MVSSSAIQPAFEVTFLTTLIPSTPAVANFPGIAVQPKPGDAREACVVVARLPEDADKVLALLKQLCHPQNFFIVVAIAKEEFAIEVDAPVMVAADGILAVTDQPDAIQSALQVIRDLSSYGEIEVWFGDFCHSIRKHGPYLQAGIASDTRENIPDLADRVCEQIKRLPGPGVIFLAIAYSAKSDDITTGEVNGILAVVAKITHGEVIYNLFADNSLERGWLRVGILAASTVQATGEANNA
ncbi:hypothetical protein LGV61_13010 [Desulfurispirillum indicum]|uniref:hypothetical protein n=1 Tax=Desulfurispirillum indicum TaxID=936456 RepID=UPI001CFBC547|nr:hypothetical protein [Desulfurispirillum indicum]UCZ56631.1 hypothetical protein LGV61_13010 [Desulfurispirillum indicum]